MLEGIAFASLSANKDKYSEIHANFSKHWRAKDMLAVMDTVNPGFYPQPIVERYDEQRGMNALEPKKEGATISYSYMENAAESSMRRTLIPNRSTMGNTKQRRLCGEIRSLNF